tara:strand:- start:428 stop:922 length:495 start_codon:yes stop_codon:yes gene_type:complete
MSEGEIPNLKIHDLLRLAPKRQLRQRVGRGYGSGSGKTSGRGQKGAGARAGTGRRWQFEGGQTPILRRMPKLSRFSNFRFKRRYQIVNVGALDVFADETIVDPALLIKKGLASKGPVKILGNGDLSRKLTVRASKFSKSATLKIEAAGGNSEVLEIDHAINRAD